jgi:protein ImuA
MNHRNWSRVNRATPVKCAVEREDVRSLRARVTAIERGAAYGDGTGREEKGILPLGLAEIDQTLPAGGLACGEVHEVSGSAVGGFAAWLAGRLVRHAGGAVLWCVKSGSTSQLYGPGLAAFGLDVGRLVIVRSRRRADMLWAMEESLHCSSFAAVIGECDDAINLTASRRLQLAAEAGGTTGFILRRGGIQRGGLRRSGITAGADNPKISPSACSSRWEIDACSGAPETPGIGTSGAGISPGTPGMGTRWQVSLKRCRGGFGTGTWLVEHDEATCDFSMVATPGDRSVEAGEERRLAG